MTGFLLGLWPKLSPVVTPTTVRRPMESNVTVKHWMPILAVFRTALAVGFTFSPGRTLPASSIANRTALASPSGGPSAKRIVEGLIRAGEVVHSYQAGRLTPSEAL